jgi:hypothetical protein
MTQVDKPEHPTWWTAEHSAGWESVRAAVKESWAKEGAGKTPALDEWTAAERALRFGHGARHQYDKTGEVSWAEAEPILEADWAKLNPAHPWPQARHAVMHGWHSHTRMASSIGSRGMVHPVASGFGSSPAGDSGSGTGDP